MKRPSPALLISCVALFASLGGTGYAATQLHSGAGAAKSKKAAKAVTKSEVNKLIAGYLKAHHVGAVGPAGPQGASGGAGAEGKTGPQGPGAQRIDVEQLGELAATKIATVGIWTLTLTCKNTGASVVINGPGQFRYTESFGPIGGTASTASNEVTVDGFTSGVGNGAQQGIHGFLTSGTTMEQLDLEITATNGGLFESCGVVGDAIPAA